MDGNEHNNRQDAAYRYPGEELGLFEQAQNWKKYFAGKIIPFLRGDIAEVGAGIGGTTPYLLTPSVKSLLCLEPDADLCRLISEKKEAGKLTDKVSIMQGNLHDVDPSHRYDVILYLDVLEHIADDAAELAMAATFLKPGGHLVVLVPANPAFYSRFDKALGHYRRYDRKTLRAAVPSGMEEEMLTSLDLAGFMAYACFGRLGKSPLPSAGSVRIWDKLLIPVSRMLDPLIGNSLGKSLLGTWKKP